jgi:hypothetical protein
MEQEGIQTSSSSNISHKKRGYAIINTSSAIKKRKILTLTHSSLEHISDSEGQVLEENPQENIPKKILVTFPKNINFNTSNENLKDNMESPKEIIQKEQIKSSSYKAKKSSANKLEEEEEEDLGSESESGNYIILILNILFNIYIYFK